jgi:Protein of unknown function (DUF5674)
MDPAGPPADVVIVERPIERTELRRLVDRFFGDMVKVVVDVRRRAVAIGGELHADAEALLLEGGSLQADVWGANYYPGLGAAHCLEFTALINIRPAQGNRSMVIEDEAVREAVREVVHALVGKGDAL